MGNTLDKDRLGKYLRKQLHNFFPDSESSLGVGSDIIERSLEKTLYCFKGINSPVYREEDGSPKFNHLHGDQYATFLYFVSRVAFEFGNEEVYYKAALLNKALHGIDLFGHVKMPRRFLLVHPVGTIIGRAKIGENVVIYQGVTIGGKHDRDGSINYPRIASDCVLYANSTILGRTELPDKTIVGANSFITDFKVKEENSLVVGSHPSIRVLDNHKTFSFFS